MRFGLFCSPKADAPGFRPETGRGFFDYLEFNVEAEALGFHSSFSVEHHFSGWNQVSSTLMLLERACHAHDDVAAGHGGDRAAMAQSGVARRRGGDARSSLAWPSRSRHRQGLPAQRIQGLSDFAEEAEARFERRSRCMTRAWTTRERFSHKGRFWHFEDIVVEPPPAQRPHPPLWVAAGNPHSIRRAAARGFNLILDQYASPAALGERIAIYKAEREANRLLFDPMQVTVARQLYVAKDKADKEAALVRQAQYAPDDQRGAHARRQDRFARARLCRQGRRDGGKRPLWHARRDRGHDRSIARRRGNLCVAHDRRWCRSIAPLRARNHGAAFAREPAARAAE